MQPLLITMGDPTGVGPELIIKTLYSKCPANLQASVADCRRY